MLDFTPVREKQITIADLCADLTPNDLRDLTNEMVDTILSLIQDCTDHDVTFIPSDPAAYDNAAATDAEINLPWTLGHLIVHTTASAEEAAFIAAEMARGVLRDGRSRYETHWTTITTLDQCIQRLEESRRMRLATLHVWPDRPHLDVAYESRQPGVLINPITRFVLGLRHDDSHLAQIAEVIRQSHTARHPIL
jgi:hypothetical protein